MIFFEGVDVLSLNGQKQFTLTSERNCNSDVTFLHSSSIDSRKIRAHNRLMKHAISLFALSLAALQTFAADLPIAPVKSDSVIPRNRIDKDQLIEVRSGTLGAAAITRLKTGASNLIEYPIDTQNQAEQRLEVPPNSILAFGEKRIYWFTTAGSSPGLNSFSLDKRESTNLAPALRGVLDLKSGNDSIYFLTLSGRIFSLAMVSPSDGQIKNLDTLDNSHQVVKFGNSGNDDIVLIDPISAQFRLDQIKPFYRAGAWKSIKSDLTKPSDWNSQQNVSVQPGVRMFTAKILSHASDPLNKTHTFVVAATREYPVTSAITVNAEGTEIRRFTMGIPEQDRPLLRMDFASSANDLSGLSFWLKDGSKLTYKGVK